MGFGLRIRGFELRNERSGGGGFLRQLAMSFEIDSRFAEDGASAVELRHRGANLLDTGAGVNQRSIRAHAGEIGLAGKQNGELGSVVEDCDELALFYDIPAVESNLSQLTTHSEAQVAIIMLDDTLKAWGGSLRVVTTDQDYDKNEDDIPRVPAAHRREPSRWQLCGPLRKLLQDILGCRIERTSMKFHLSISLILVAMTAASCSSGGSAPASASGSESPVTPQEAETIAKEAYVYAYPMLENYRTMYLQAIDRTAPGYTASFNELVHKTELLGPEFRDVVRPNNDTVYSVAWLDLRAQPVVIGVPEVVDRYYSIQLVDMFTHNFGYIGTRGTGTAAGSFLVAGPGWQGTQPDGINEVFRSESAFVYCIIRTEARGPDDLEAVHGIQRGYSLTPMNVFLGRSSVPAVSGLTFPLYDADRVRSAAFIDLVNGVRAQCAAPEEADLLAKFSRIGIRKEATAASLGLSPEIRDAVDAGVGQALIEIQGAVGDLRSVEGVRVASRDGWQGVDGLFGDGAEMRQKYLVRAAAAMVGLYGNDVEEAYYPMASADSEGRPLDASTRKYTIRFERDQLPAVDAFWSMTMYSLPDQLMVANPIARYSIGDRSDLRHAEDGSLTIYIQKESPGAARQSNWLPAPNGPFSLQLRMYLPKPEALDPLYLPPPARGGE